MQPRFQFNEKVTKADEENPDKTQPETCVKCGAELGSHQGMGRPPKYCQGTGCKRAAEYERRRIDRALEDLEGRERFLRKSLNDDIGSRKHKEAEISWYREEIARLESRLLKLCEWRLTWRKRSRILNLTVFQLNNALWAIAESGLVTEFSVCRLDERLNCFVDRMASRRSAARWMLRPGGRLIFLGVARLLSLLNLGPERLKKRIGILGEKSDPFAISRAEGSNQTLVVSQGSGLTTR
jgi:hypothetical protein